MNAYYDKEFSRTNMWNLGHDLWWLELDGNPMNQDIQCAMLPREFEAVRVHGNVWRFNMHGYRHWCAVEAQKLIKSVEDVR